MNKIIVNWNFRLEKEFQSELNKQLRNNWWFVYKMPDTWFAKKPYDMYAISPEWITYHCELKIIAVNSININKLEPQQHWSLKYISKINPNIAMVLIWSKKHSDYKIFTYNEFMSLSNTEWTVKVF